MVVEDESDGETLVTFSSVQLHSIKLGYILLHAIPIIQLPTQLEAVKLSELMEGTFLYCGK